MAVTAKFLADFSSFQQAVQKAEVELRSFETGAGKVEKALTRVANGFSGQKVIQDANLAAAAVEKIGGATKLTESEQQRLNALVTEALSKYKALGMEAPKSMLDLAKATEKVPEQLTLAQKGADLLKSSFGQFTAANLAASAIQTLTSEVGRFVGQGVQLGGIQQSFNRLSAGVKEDSSKMLAAIQEGTRGMVSNFDLMQQANKAMLLGLPVTAESMGELAKTATVLGKAMGQDATKSLDDLITALGRSSPLILDNLGLTVKVGEANDIYAKKLGKTAEQLTEAEKKTAFYQAAMEAAREKTQQLGEQTKTLGEIATTVWTKFGNVVTEAASAINVGAGRAVSSWGEFVRFMQNSIKFGTGQAVVMEDIRSKADALAQTLKRDVNLALPETAKHTELSAKALKAAAKAMKELKEESQDLVNRGLKVQREEQKKLTEAILREIPILKAFVSDYQQDILKFPPIMGNWKQANIETTQTLLQMVDAGMRVPELTEKQVKAILTVKDTTALWRDELAALSQAMTQLSQTANNTVVSAMASMVNAFNVGLKALDSLKEGFHNLTSGKGLSSILSGFTGIISGIGGIVGAAQAAIQIGKALFNVFDRDKGRDLVEGFAAEFSGGFDGPNGLHQQLLKLGDEGEQLWIKLTQKVGRNNIDQARAAIDEVRAALERLRTTADSFGGITYHPPDISIDPSGEVPEFAGGSGGFRNFGQRGKLVKLHNWEAVVRPGDPMPGGGGGVVVNVYGSVTSERDLALTIERHLDDRYRLNNKVRAT